MSITPISTRREPFVTCEDSMMNDSGSVTAQAGPACPRARDFGDFRRWPPKVFVAAVARNYGFEELRGEGNRLVAQRLRGIMARERRPDGKSFEPPANRSISVKMDFLRSGAGYVAGETFQFQGRMSTDRDRVRRNDLERDSDRPPAYRRLHAFQARPVERPSEDPSRDRPRPAATDIAATQGARIARA